MVFYGRSTLKTMNPFTCLRKGSWFFYLQYQGYQRRFHVGSVRLICVLTLRGLQLIIRIS
ncbi:hypothetical protein SAMN04488688_101846 [Paenibacillus sp. cl141a]|nr:hypothetical protein SAMN04488688_101846 [Paenibacillus sp. cl141a]